MAFRVERWFTLRQAAVDKASYLGRSGRSVLERDAFCKGVQSALIRLSFNQHTVRLGLLVAGVADTMNQLTVVAEQQKPLRVVVETSGRVDVGYIDERRQRIASLLIGELGQHAVGLVQQVELTHGLAR